MRIHLRKVLFLIFIPFVLLGQGGEEAMVKGDTISRERNVKIIGLPIAFYTPETQFGIGGGGQIFLLNNTDQYNQRLSNIFFSAIYTTAGQILFNATPQIYLGKGDYLIDGAYAFEIFPNSFWGIGPNTLEDNEEQYNQTTHQVEIGLLKRLPPYLNFGFTYNFSNHQVTEVQEGGILDSGAVLGAERTVISGFGAVFNKDSRNDISSPTKGQYLELRANVSAEIFGATHGFNKFILDLRQYLPIGLAGVLATQLYLENNLGDVPFQGMAYFGGGNSARGYFFGRFIDKSMYIVQAEYRYRFKPRWAVAAYSLLGSVAADFNDLSEFRSIKPAFGGGVRYKILKDQGTWLRLDFGIGKDGQNGVYFGINEAF